MFLEFFTILCGSGVFLLALVTALKKLFPKRKTPDNVVLLYQIGRGAKAPSISPFPLKLETFLRMANIPYINDQSGKFSSKGKTPWMEYNGIAVADSQLCIEFLKKQLGIDMNSNYSAKDIAVGRAFQKMTEENLYWTMCAWTFRENVSSAWKVIPYRGPKLWLTVWYLQYILGKEMWGHGIGRHSNEDIWSFGSSDLKAIAEFLGTKKFFLGDYPSEVDCAMFGMLAMINWNMPGSRHEKLVKDELPNLVAYCERMRDTFWLDWDQHIISSESYVDDHNKAYSHKTILSLTDINRNQSNGVLS